MYVDGLGKEPEEDDSWCDIKDVQVKEIGFADKSIKLNSIVCSNFRAG